MKNALRFLMLALLLSALTLGLVACGGGGDQGDDPACEHTYGEWQVTKAPTQDAYGEETRTCSKCGNPETRQVPKLEPELPPVVLDSASFDDKVVTYNGENQVNENFRGAPRRSEVNFEYYDANGNLISTNTGVKDPGVYTVRAVVTLDGYAPNYIEATLTIVEPYKITYTSDISGFEFPDTNPTSYSHADPVIVLAEAKFEGYKFKGWYIGDVEVTAIDPKLDLFSGDVTIEAVFQPYLAYPTPYKANSNNATCPDTLPAIPGYDSLPDDAFLLYDMSNIREGNDEEAPNFYFENRLDYTEYESLFNTELTAGGQLVWEWIDFNDTLTADDLPEDFENAYRYEAYDGKFSPAIRLVPNETDYSKYDTVEFWIYSENASGATMGFTFWTDHKDTCTCRMSITLNFSGWKKFSFSYSDFEAVHGNMHNMHEIRLLAQDTVYNGGTNNGTLTLYGSGTNYLFFSNIYLTNRDSNYNGRKVTADVELIKIMENYARLTSHTTDSGLAAYVDNLLDTYDPDSTSIWGNDLTTAEGVNGLYGDLYKLALAWNTPALGNSYYHNEEILSLIGEVANLMYDEDYFGKTIGDGALFGTYTFDAYREACMKLPATLMIIGDHIEHAHAKSWLHPVINLCPNGVGAGVSELETATITAMSHILLGNKLNFLTATRHVLHCYTSGSTTQATAESMALIAALADTEFAPNKACLDTIFDWYMNVVDAAFLGNRLVNSQITPADSMMNIVLIRHLFSAEQQAILDASIVGYVNACGINLVDYVDAHGAYVAQFDYAELVKDLAPSGTGHETLYHNKDLGYVVYKTDSQYLFLPINGTPVAEGFDADVSAITTATLDSFKAGNKLAVAAGAYALLVGEGELIVEEGPLCEVKGDTSVYVALGSSDKENDSDYFSASAPCIVYSVADAGVETFTVHYSGEATTLTFYILEGSAYELPYEELENITVSESGGMMIVEITLPYGSDDVTFSLPLKG